MEKKTKHRKKSVVDIVTEASNSVHNGLESVKAAITKVISGADKINNDVANKAKSVASNFKQKTK